MATAAAPAPKTSEVQHAPWVDVVAGGSGGSIAKSLLSPFQRIVVLQQLGEHRQYNSMGKLIRHIYEKDGLRGFWKGNWTSMILRVPYSGIQFLLYTQTKFFFQNHFVGAAADPSRPPSANAEMVEKFVMKCGAGGISATVAGALVYPGEVVRLRLMSGDPQYRKIMATVRSVYKETHSLKNFYSGLGASLMQRVPDILVSFATYETVKYAIMDHPGVDFYFFQPLFAAYHRYRGAGAEVAQGERRVKNIVATMAGGSLAALASIAVAFPLDVAKRRLGMSGMLKSQKRYSGVRDVLRTIYAEEGVRGWYAGAKVEALRCVPQVVLMWFLIEGIQDYLTKHV
ncbi:solute carrier family 25 (mitochondrial carrier protein), member 16 [Strigomonas culicis]|uniref:Solute carrier family 25 (Mitochondrial carrier protein), member 16 n=1 Tax=Strigomonas culicis TaxID=28005 RepID=S9V9T3_9TRYP|nr:solute carrier family 25 (mitochondrial carrier protein), member 16 [Strigomonas culicis]|eukprot:EPY23736.1 solute carrier family 25 (mitochondrial carrier protein), member 16 [Strigomonas culicis]